MDMLFPSFGYLVWIIICSIILLAIAAAVLLLIRKLFFPSKGAKTALILPVQGKTPRFGNNCFFAPNATIAGDVVTGNECTFWFNSVVRGDVNFIKLGNRVNVQDGAIIHCTYQKSPTVIGSNVSIGHNAIVHGCTVHDNVLIGMGAIVMDRCIIHSNTIIAAGAVVTEDTVVEAGAIYAGIPARKVKELGDSYMKDSILRIADNYVQYASWFQQ